jgi:hypothetical protein
MEIDVESFTEAVSANAATVSEAMASGRLPFRRTVQTLINIREVARWARGLTHQPLPVPATTTDGAAAPLWDVTEWDHPAEDAQGVDK